MSRPHVDWDSKVRRPAWRRYVQLRWRALVYSYGISLGFVADPDCLP